MQEKLCNRCQKFLIPTGKTKLTCKFCDRDVRKLKAMFGDDFAFTKGSTRKWVAPGKCPIDLQLPA